MESPFLVVLLFKLCSNLSTKGLGETEKIATNNGAINHGIPKAPWPLSQSPLPLHPSSHDRHQRTILSRISVVKTKTANCLKRKVEDQQIVFFGGIHRDPKKSTWDPETSSPSSWTPLKMDVVGRRSLLPFLGRSSSPIFRGVCC